MKYSRAYLIIMVCFFILLLTSCGKQYTAEQTVKSFVVQNMEKEVGTDIVDFADLGTSRHINDSIITMLRKKSVDLYKKEIKYGVDPCGKVYYLRMRYIRKGDTLQNTFYLDSTLTRVVAFK